MMQTLLTQTPSAPANGLDKAPLSGSVESNGIDGEIRTDNKGDFAALISRAQSREQEAVQASQSRDPTAKSLASESAPAKGEAGKALDPDAEQQAEELLASDFLLRLQDALKLDTSLVMPPLAVTVTQSASAADGNLLPPEGEQEGAALEVGEQATAAVRLARQLAANGKASSQAALEPSPSEGEGAASEALSAERAAGKGEALAVDGKSSKSLTGAERMAQLARVLPADEPPQSAKPDASLTAKAGGDSPSSPTASNSSSSQGQTLQAATHGAALKAFNEGIVPPDTVPNTDGHNGQGAAGKEDKRVAEGGQSGASGASATQGATSAVQGATASSAQPSAVSATAQSDSVAAPVLVAPEQVLAQAQSRGPQTPLTSISAGIKQIEVTGSDAVRKAVPPGVKTRGVEADKSLLATASSSESGQSQGLQHGQNSQPQLTESRALATEGALRREPSQLPHLKLASQEAPAELHQKVNVMLAEKLQQAEIQLDPLGLGKMKIQIQLDSSSQANVHFVVQHGQTREMLEQAMPRLREMLAGQGIQLGQTQVQQQSQQQQQQGQPASGGQGQQSQSGGESLAGNGQSAGDISGASPGVLAESANGSGIDFYA